MKLVPIRFVFSEVKRTQGECLTCWMAHSWILPCFQQHTIISVPQSSIIDRFGRRTLLCGGYLLMALILVLLETSLLLSVSKCLSGSGPASEFSMQDSRVTLSFHFRMASKYKLTSADVTPRAASSLPLCSVKKDKQVQRASITQLSIVGFVTNIAAPALGSDMLQLYN